MFKLAPRLSSMFKRLATYIAILILCNTNHFVYASFSDVPTNHVDAEAIHYLQDHNIISGSEDGLFHPELGLTRCELTKIALKVGNISILNRQSSIFPDLPTSSWCHNYAYTARSNNILQGYPDGTFRPNQKVTEIEALKIILNSLQVRLPTVTRDLYIDVHSTDWWAPYIAFVENNNLSPMPSGGYYGINNEFQRAKMARVVYRGLLLRNPSNRSPTSTSSTDLQDIDTFLADLNSLDIPSL